MWNANTATLFSRIHIQSWQTAWTRFNGRDKAERRGHFLSWPSFWPRRHQPASIKPACTHRSHFAHRLIDQITCSSSLIVCCRYSFPHGQITELRRPVACSQSSYTFGSVNNKYRNFTRSRQAMTLLGTSPQIALNYTQANIGRCTSPTTFFLELLKLQSQERSSTISSP